MRALACAFLFVILSPLRSLSPQRHPPPPNTGSAAALPPSVAGSLLVGRRAREDRSARSVSQSVISRSHPALTPPLVQLSWIEVGM